MAKMSGDTRQTVSNIEELLAGGRVSVTRGQTPLTYKELAGMAAAGLDGCQVTAGTTTAHMAHISVKSYSGPDGTIPYVTVSYTGGPIIRTSGELNSPNALDLLGRVYDHMR